LKTPCVNVCLLNTETGLCIGCGRTIDEIARSTMSDASAITGALPKRMERSERAKG